MLTEMRKEMRAETQPEAATDLQEEMMGTTETAVMRVIGTEGMMIEATDVRGHLDATHIETVKTIGQEETTEVGVPHVKGSHVVARLLRT